jgi:diguanylate cyclase (GGDEF)-like protein
MAPGPSTRSPRDRNGAAVAALEARLEPGADPHTGCLNEAAMATRLDEEINRSRRQGTPLSCLLLTLDDLEAIALRHGAPMSEQVLGHVGTVLRREFRRFDRVAYLGRGEFAIVLAGTGGTPAEVAARRALERVHAVKLEQAGERRPLRSSIGLGEWHDSQGAWELVAAARAALLGAGRREPDGLAHAPLTATAD